MSTLTLVFTILQVISGLAVTAIVLLQSGKNTGASEAFSGSTETMLGSGKTSSRDARLAKMTKWFGLVFVILTLALNMI